MLGLNLVKPSQEKNIANEHPVSRIISTGSVSSCTWEDKHKAACAFSYDFIFSIVVLVSTVVSVLINEIVLIKVINRGCRIVASDWYLGLRIILLKRLLDIVFHLSVDYKTILSILA